MPKSRKYQLGLLYLTHSLISADGTFNQNEYTSLMNLKNSEGIPDSIFKEFEKELMASQHGDLYEKGIHLIKSCNKEEKLNAFSYLYKMSDADGAVDKKEVKLLLYSIREAGVQFNDVIARAKGR